MSIELLFLIFGGLGVLAALGIAITRNVIHAALLLVVVILSMACIFVLLQAEFLAVVQVLVYAGGVVVLLAFGIMLVKRPSDGELRSGHGRILPALLVLLPLLYLLHRTVIDVSPVQSQKAATEDQVRTIGIGFMTEHLLAFELVAFLLLVVLVGAGYLAQKAGES